MPPPRYDLLAIDLDGTLFDPAGRISDASRAAIQEARKAGLRITICTGRGLVECVHALEAIEQADPVVVAGGSLIACPVTRRTQHRFSIETPLVSRVVDTLLRHDHPALVLKDPLEAGYDYLCVTGDRDLPLDPVTEWWFNSMNVRVRRVTRLEEDEHPEHTVRVGACGLSGHLETIRIELASSLGDEAIMHNFPAVVAPEHASRAKNGQKLHILELFSSRANKWDAIRVLARKWGIPRERIAAVGDEINDVCMIENAGLGVAMGNAVEAVRLAADRHAPSNAEDGVAHTVERIMKGEW